MAAFNFRLTGRAPPINVEAYTPLARRKIPAMAWPYLSSGADDLITLADNREAFRRWRLRMRSLTGVTKPDLKTTIGGTELSMPVLLVGLAFKPGTDDLRESPHIDFARKLLQAGYVLSIYDPSLRPEHLIGQNLGYAYSHLPQLNALLIGREAAERESFDLVVDANGTAGTLALKVAKILSIHAL